MYNKTYQYSKFQKGVYILFFIIFLLGTLFAWISSILGLIFNSNFSIEDIIATLAAILVGSFLLFIAYYLNMFMPDIRIRNDGFQLKTIFYQSQWLRWDEILLVKEHFLSTKNYKLRGIRIEHIHPIYSFVGIFQQMEGKSFLITEKIQGYDDLIQVLETNRPDLFQH